MITDRPEQSSATDGASATYRGTATVEVPQLGCSRVDVELLGGRRRWSVGGRIAERPRWWRGEITWDGDGVLVEAGTRITVALDDGRAAKAVVEHAAAPRLQVRGIEPPPFAVP